MDFHPEIFACVKERIHTLANFSEDEGRITRPFLMPSMRKAVDEVSQWCTDIDLEARVDPLGNVAARLPSKRANAKTFVLGSHLDSVRNAGKFDGPLGVVLAMATLEQFKEWRLELPFHLEVIGFSDEEGLRYQTAYLGSSYYAGKFNKDWLEEVDAEGITMAQALENWGSNPKEAITSMETPNDLLGYCEVHIEQGPVLEQAGRAIGLVQSICGQTRIAIEIHGMAGHAGTTPMDLRRDALATAAIFITEVEMLAISIPQLVATVGEITIEPGASNVIPARARLSLDLRHADDEVRIGAIQSLNATLENLCERRGLEHRWTVKQHKSAVQCDEALTDHLRQAALTVEGTLPELISGAGHDAVMMSEVCPVSMLFVQCKDGLSHHPDEFVRDAHNEAAFRALLAFVQRLARHYA